MKLPGFLPESFDYCRTEDVLPALTQHGIEAVVTFFEYACEDETWCKEHGELMTALCLWITRQGRAVRERLIAAIQPHYLVLAEYLPEDMTITLQDGQAKINSLLFFKQGRITTSAIFEDIKEFLCRGSVEFLWRKSEEEILARMRVAVDWELFLFAEQCATHLKRYLRAENVVERLFMAHGEHLEAYLAVIVTYLSEMTPGIVFEDDLTVTITRLTDEGWELLKKVTPLLTRVGARGDVAMELPEWLASCPRLRALDLSMTTEVPDSIFLPHLRDLDLSFSEWLTDEKLRLVVKSIPQLHAIHLKGDDKISYRGWAEVATLKELRLLEYSRIAPEELAMIRAGCPQLSDFELR